MGAGSLALRKPTHSERCYLGAWLERKRGRRQDTAAIAVHLAVDRILGIVVRSDRDSVKVGRQENVV